MLNAFGPEICADFVVMLTMLSVCRCRVGVAAGVSACHCGQTPSKNTLANCQRQLCAEGTTTLWKTQKSLMKIACKWFLFLPACHVMVARFACKTFGLLSARHTHTHTHRLLHMLWLCAKPAKAKSLPRTWTWKSRLPDALNSKFSHIFLDSLRRRRRLQLELCTHTHTCPGTHTCSYTTQTACAVATAALQRRLLDLQLVARR